MLTTFKYQVIGMLRDKVLMVWSLGFIIVLSLIFMAMFSNLQDSYEPSAQPFGIVQDDAYDAAPGFDACIRGISDEDAETRLVEPTFFANYLFDLLISACRRYFSLKLLCGKHFCKLVAWSVFMVSINKKRYEIFL